MYAKIAKRETYTVITDKHCELKQGEKFRVKSGPVSNGTLCLFKIGALLTIGRYYADVAGLDWIVQPGRLIADYGTVPVQIRGVVEVKG